MQDEKIKVKTSNSPTPTDFFLEPVGVRVGYFPRTSNIGDSSKDPRNFGRSTNPEQFQDRIIVMLMFNDIDWSKNESSKACPSNSERVKNYARGFRVDIGHSPAQETKKNYMERTLTNLKESGILLLMSWWKRSKKVDIRYSEVSVR